MRARSVPPLPTMRRPLPTRPTLSAELLGRRFRFDTAPGLFCADRIDDGTKLLLAHLPARPPHSVLDLGCGYGALGLPVAAAHPHANVLLVDRDALAAEYARRNAVTNGLPNVQARPSLGFVETGDEPFDWILCNVPARIGDRAMYAFLDGGRGRLTERGELRVVVIRDLGPAVVRYGALRECPVRLDAEGSRHLVFSLEAGPVAPPADETIYLRDRVRPGALELDRPTDVSEEPAHLREALPMLLSLLPRKPARTLVWRGGYGAAAVELALRGAEVVAADRDLLATAFTRRNAVRHGASLATRDGWELAQTVQGGERFDLVVMELLASAGEDAMRSDLAAAVNALTPGGTALVLSLSKVDRSSLQPFALTQAVTATTLASRGAYTVTALRAKPRRG